MKRWACLVLLGLCVLPSQGGAQALGFGAGNGQPLPINITSTNGIAWNQKAQTVTATGNAKAIRGAVTVTANQLVAHYEKVAQGAPTPGAAAPGAPPSKQDMLSGVDSGQSRITRLDAVGNVHIFTATDQAFGDLAVYSMDRDELALTGRNLRFITPNETVTAQKAIQYFSKERKAVAIGDAVVVSKNQRSVAADRLVGYFLPPAAAPGSAQSGSAGNPDAQSGKLREVQAFGHVVVHSATEIATGDEGVYHPDTSIAILTGNVHITRGPNELAGNKAQVNMDTGVATLLATPGARVSGMILPDSAPPSATPGAAR